MEVDIQNIAAIAFVIFLTLFVFFHKKGRTVHKIFYPFLYLTMYRTTWGLKLMDSLSRHKKVMRVLSWASIIVGFLGMIFISYVMVDSLITLFMEPDAPPSVGPVLPFKAKSVFFVPFFYWIISLIIIAVVHEFAHGVIARYYNMKVTSSGFAFLSVLIPIVPLAFVEPDEKQLFHRPMKQQLAVFSAGPFSNFLLGFICLGLVVFALSPITNAVVEPNGVTIIDYASEDGVVFPAEELGLKDHTIIRIDDSEVRSLDNLSSAVEFKKPGDVVFIETDKGVHEMTLGTNPNNESKAYMGVLLEQSLDVPGKDGFVEDAILNSLTWSSTLLMFLFILNLGVGMFNLLPLGPLDGGRMFKLVVLTLFKKEKGEKVFHYVGLFFLGIILINLFFSFFV